MTIAVSRLLVRIGTPVLVVGLARVGAWTLLAAVTSFVFVRARQRWRDERHRRPRRLAALAVISAGDWNPDPAVQRLVLSAMVMPTGSLSRASALLRDDRCLARWAAGAERIALAEMAMRTRPWLRPEQTPRSRLTLASWAATTAGLAAGAAITGSALVAFLFVVAFTGSVTALTDLREDRKSTPLLLALMAAEPSGGRRPIADLTETTDFSATTVAHAEQILRSWPIDNKLRDDALMLLDDQRHDPLLDSAPPRWHAIGTNSAGVLAGTATWIVPL